MGQGSETEAEEKWDCTGAGRQCELTKCPEGNGNWAGAGASTAEPCSFPRHAALAPCSTQGTLSATNPLCHSPPPSSDTGAGLLWSDCQFEHSSNTQHVPAAPTVGRFEYWAMDSREGVVLTFQAAGTACRGIPCSCCSGSFPKPSGFQAEVSSVFLMASAQSGHPCSIWEQH